MSPPVQSGARIDRGAPSTLSSERTSRVLLFAAAGARSCGALSLGARAPDALGTMNQVSMNLAREEPALLKRLVSVGVSGGISIELLFKT